MALTSLIGQAFERFCQAKGENRNKNCTLS